MRYVESRRKTALVLRPKYLLHCRSPLLGLDGRWRPSLRCETYHGAGGYYSTFANAALSPTISAPRSLPSVPLFL
jgi:hypothetical protein